MYILDLQRQRPRRNRDDDEDGGTAFIPQRVNKADLSDGTGTYTKTTRLSSATFWVDEDCGRLSCFKA